MAGMESTKIILEDGTELRDWSSYSIDSDFLTPTDGWSFTVGGLDLKKYKAAQKLWPDYRVQIWVDGALQMTGIIDSVEWESSSSGGTICTVSGRDVLRSLCKANIWPGFNPQRMTASEMVEYILQSYYFEDNIPTLFHDNSANRAVIGLKGAFNPKNRSALQKKLIENSKAHSNEGAFEFIARTLSRIGLWIWATADGNIVISGPEYDQAPSYHITRKFGNYGTNWPHASYRHDRTSSPTGVEVSGKSAHKEWDKTANVYYEEDKDHGEAVIEPAYMLNDEANTTEQCKFFAKQELSKLKQSENVYTVTAMGHKDRGTGNVFAIDTIAAIDDEFLGIKENMYVFGRTFRKDANAGTTTELRCCPLGRIQFSDLDAAGIA